MKKILFICLLFVTFVILKGESVYNYNRNISWSSKSEQTELEFTVPQYRMETISTEGNTYSRIVTEGEGEYLLPGYPEVPIFSALVAVPDQGRIEFEVTGSEQSVIEDIVLYPRQQLQSESELPSREFVINQQYYQSEELFPVSAAHCSEPVIMRDYRLVRLTFNPFQYDPASQQLLVNERIQVRIYSEAGEGVNELEYKGRPSRYFDKMFSNMIINYESVRREEEFQKPSILYIYINNSTVENYLQYLVDWRRQKGFEVHAVSTSVTGNNTAGIHNYIQEAYDEWENPPEYVCLLGDANGSYNIPCYYVDTGETDNNYVMLEGNDLLPDAAIGRIPFENTGQLAVIITKILNYETEPYMNNTNWFQRGLMVGDASTSGTTCIDSKRYVVDMMEQTAPNVDAIEVYSGNFSSQMSSNLNQGCVYFNYRGFGDFSGWSTYAIDSLTNGWMLPVMVFLTCGTGSYGGWSDCMSEHFVKVGTTSNPKGGVAAISTATNMTHTTFNNCMDVGIWAGLFVDENWNMGMGLCRGKLNMFNTFPNNPSNHTNQFISWNNLMGDPAMDVWSDVPAELTVTAPDEINPAMDAMEVQVFSAGEPVCEAWVTLLDEEDYGVTVYTEESGSAWLPLAGLAEGELILTVSKHNCCPEQTTIGLSADNGFVEMSMEIIDVAGGNGDGQPNPGESLVLEITLDNFFQSDLNALTLTASSPAADIIFEIDEIDIAELPGNQSLVCDESFVLNLPENITGLEFMIIDLLLTDGSQSWSARLSQPVIAPCITLSSFELSVTGNIDPGEDSEMTVYVLNEGTAAANSVNIELQSMSSLLNIVDSTAFIGQIPPGSMGNNSGNPFHLISQAETIPGTQIQLRLLVETPELQHPPVVFLLTVGESGIGDPVGPDGGGYYCYDETDIGYLDCPEYNWIEIDPEEGGSGTIINLYDQGNTGDVEQVEIPINFTFYDINYDEITICSNGWISPGNTQNKDFMNGYIPGPGGPSPMIAPFWDDLMTNSGNVCYYHDAVNHTFIVEWNNMLIDYSNSNVTFQVIIYDSDYYPNSAGNSNLLFQYADFDNDDLGSYGGFYVYHGQFASVGIEDHTSTQGLMYSYNNTYPVQAAELANETAIFFSSAPIPHQEAYLVLFEDEIIDSGGDGQLDYGETAEVKISISNIGEQTADNVSAVAFMEDEYVSLITDSVVYPDIPGGFNIFPESGFEVVIANDCPNGHAAGLFITLNYNDIIVEQNRVLTVYAPALNNSAIFIMNDDNGNFLADPGESFDLGVVIENQGGAPVYNAQLLLTSLSADLVLEEPLNQIHQIAANSDAYLIYPASLSSNVQQGDYLSMILDITGDYEYNAELQYDLSVGMALEDFETGDFSRFPWETGGASDFVISTLAHNGVYSAQSGDIDDDQYSWLGIQIESPQDGQISFWMKTSTEAGWDFVRFYIDETEQEEWSGENSWSQYEYNISAGIHELRWEYDKDSIISAGSDCFWLDDIDFPSASGDTPQVILTDSAGFEFILNDDESETVELGLINISAELGQFDVRIEGQNTDWLSTVPENGFIPPSETLYIDLVCTPLGLPTGEYDATLCISDSFGNDNLIAVHLSYTLNSAEDPELPDVTAYLGNYPNPFNPTTAFSFQLAEAQQVNIDIFNIKGQKVSALLSAYLTAGRHDIQWNGTDDNNKQLASGIYFARFHCSELDQCNKILLLK